MQCLARTCFRVERRAPRSLSAAKGELDLHAEVSLTLFQRQRWGTLNKLCHSLWTNFLVIQTRLASQQTWPQISSEETSRSPAKSSQWRAQMLRASSLFLELAQAHWFPKLLVASRNAKPSLSAFHAPRDFLLLVVLSHAVQCLHLES